MNGKAGHVNGEEQNHPKNRQNDRDAKNISHLLSLAVVRITSWHRHP